MVLRRLSRPRQNDRFPPASKPTPPRIDRSYEPVLHHRRNRGGCQDAKTFLLPSGGRLGRGVRGHEHGRQGAFSAGTFWKYDARTGPGAIAELSGFDKATTYRRRWRWPSAASSSGPRNERYRLGPALIRYAQIRETYFPLVTTARQIVDELSATPEKPSTCRNCRPVPRYLPMCQKAPR